MCLSASSRSGSRPLSRTRHDGPSPWPINRATLGRGGPLPWPDAIEGLTRLRRRFITTTLSNGNMSLLTDMAKNAGLPWDCILSAELVRHYKPDREAYLQVSEFLDVAPDQVLMVAAHPRDLAAARQAGLRTAYVHRPLEFGPRTEPPAAPAGGFHYVARDFLD